MKTARSIFGHLAAPTARKGMFTLSDQAVVSAANFLAGIAVGRFCSKEEFGLYTLGFTVVILLLNLQNSMIVTPYSVVFPTLPEEERKRCTGGTLVHQALFTMGTVAVLFLAAEALSNKDSAAGLPSVLRALGLAAPFILLREYARQLDISTLHNRSALLLDLCAAGIFLSTLYLTAFRGELRATRAFHLSGAACGMATAAWFAFNRGRFAWEGLRIRSDFLRNWHYAKWALAGVLANLAAIQIFPWFLAGFHGMGSTGILSTCSGVVFLANPFIMGMSNFLGPRILHAHALEGAAGTAKLIRSGTLAILAVLVPFCVFLLFFGDRLLQFLYGSKYAGNGVAVSLLAAGQLAEVVTLPIVPALYAFGRPDRAFHSYVAALAVTLAAGLPLVKYFGVPGAAAGLAAASAAGSLYRWKAYEALVRSHAAGSPR